jgi:hypothetical protein
MPIAITVPCLVASPRLAHRCRTSRSQTVDDVAGAIEAVCTGDLAHMQTRYERPLAVVGDITRALVVPAPGHRLFIADLSGIESRGLAWLCNESTKLEAWREFDHTGDPQREPYYRFATEDLKLTGAEARGTGKTADLAFGYQGSLGAWRRLVPADDTTSDAKVCAFRNAWMRRHPKKFWATSVRQAVSAINNSGQRCAVARITFIRENQFLYLELPSGRRLSYPFARIYDDDHGKNFTFRDASGGRWEWYHVLKHRGAFGGLIAENATQAICRDIFCEAMLRLEAAGYPIVAHLHDEFVCEVPDGTGDLDEFRGIITTAPGWALDFPIAAKARIADRFIEIKEPKASTVIDSAPTRRGGNGFDAESDEELDDDELEPPEIPLRQEPQMEVAIENLVATANPKQPPPDDEMPPPELDDSPLWQNSNGHAGSGFDADEFAFAGSANASDYPAGEQPRGAPKTSYVYKDARGLLYMRVTRTSGKSFPTQHWEDGRWISGWPAIAIPYRLPQLLAAPASEPVWICEGEKDADNVAAARPNHDHQSRRRGQVATRAHAMVQGEAAGLHSRGQR